MLKGKTVLLGVTGGIAAYKAAALASALVKQHCSVEVILTEHATKFIAPLTFEQLTGNRCMVDTFDRNFSHQVEHISLAHRTDLVMVAPATANVCASWPTAWRTTCSPPRCWPALSQAHRPHHEHRHV